jgi:LmbE family N-acetylglucosaminyl deacetylase
MAASDGGKQKPVALAVGAHPDDIEFMMAGTLLLLREVGAEIHMWNVANGSCGTVEHTKEEIVRLRWEEAQASAREAGAAVYPPIADDIAVYYEEKLLARAAALVRKVKPNIILTHSPGDYMEDHQNACRLAVSAAFVRGMRNFPTSPAVEPWTGDVAVYHALPYGLRDGLRRPVRAGQYVDVGSVLAGKRRMLAQHQTQKEWLDISQGADAYLEQMEQMCRQAGSMSGRFRHAEGWRRHLHLGLCAPGYDPLSELLGARCWTDPQYERSLE